MWNSKRNLSWRGCLVYLLLSTWTLLSHCPRNVLLQVDNWDWQPLKRLGWPKGHTRFFNSSPQLTSNLLGSVTRKSWIGWNDIEYCYMFCIPALSKPFSVLTLNISEEEQKNLLCHTLCDILELACSDHSESYCLATWQRGKTAEETASISESPAETSRQEEQPCKLSFLTWFHETLYIFAKCLLNNIVFIVLWTILCLILRLVGFVVLQKLSSSLV